MKGKNYTRDEWIAEGTRLFGGMDKILDWRFRCPACGNVATVREFKEAGAKDADTAAKNCIGRFVGNRGCDWAAYGLFDICAVHVDGVPVFEFAPRNEDKP